MDQLLLRRKIIYALVGVAVSWFALGVYSFAVFYPAYYFSVNRSPIALLFLIPYLLPFIMIPVSSWMAEPADDQYRKRRFRKLLI
jgi:hypothetical protein